MRHYRAELAVFTAAFVIGFLTVAWWPVEAQVGGTYESITVADTAIGITVSVTNPPGRGQQRSCMARLETAQIRYRHDGTAPTSSEGILVEVGDVVTIVTNQAARAIRFIRTGATSGVLKVSCQP